MDKVLYFPTPLKVKKMLEQEYVVDGQTFRQETTGQNTGNIRLMVGTYYAFKDEQRDGEGEDLTMFRLLRERLFYRRSCVILTLSTLLAVALAVF